MKLNSHAIAVAGLALLGYGCGSENGVSSTDSSGTVPQVAAKIAHDDHSAVDATGLKDAAYHHILAALPQILRTQLLESYKEQVSEALQERLINYLRNELKDELKDRLAQRIRAALSDDLRQLVAIRLSNALIPRMVTALPEEVKGDINQQLLASLPEALKADLAKLAVNRLDLDLPQDLIDQVTDGGAGPLADHIRTFLPDLLKDRLTDRWRDQLPTRAKTDISDGIKDQVADHLKDNLNDRAKDQLVDFIINNLSDEIKDRLVDHIKNNDKAQEALVALIKDALSDRVKHALTDLAKDQVSDRFKDQIKDRINDELKARWQNVFSNQTDRPVGWHNFDVAVKKRDKIAFAAGIVNSDVNPGQGRTHITQRGLLLGLGWGMDFGFNGDTVDGRCISKVNTTINTNTGNGRLFGTFEAQVRMDMPGTPLDGKLGTFKGRLAGNIDLPVDRLGQLEGTDVDREQVFKASIVSGRLTGHLVTDDPALRGVKLEARYRHGGGDEALTGVMHMPNGVKIVKVDIDIDATRVIVDR